MLPLSGRNGYMKWNGIELPIYNWSISAVNQRTFYRTSDSQNFPRRTAGIMSELITISGVDYIPPFYTDPTFDTLMVFDIGWMDFTVDLFRKIPITAMLNSYSLQLNYMNSNQPSFMWTATFIGCMTDKVFDVENLIINDNVVCQTSFCNKVIGTSDSTLNGGVVKHVKQAVLTYLVERPTRAQSDSNNYYTTTVGCYDRFIDLTIEGDFDYWLDAVESDSLPFEYLFQYDPSSSPFILPNMVPLEMNNLIVNIQTAELISANVRLGAAY